MKARFPLILILLVLWASFFNAQQTNYVSSQTLNSRSDSSTTSKISSQLSKEELVSILKYDEHLCFIEPNNGIKNYVSSTYLIDNVVILVSKQTEVTVLVCGGKSAYAYHSHYCHGLNRCKSGVDFFSLCQLIK